MAEKVRADGKLAPIYALCQRIANISVNALTIDPEIHILQHNSYLRFVLGKGTVSFDTSIINRGLSYNLDFEHFT